MLPHSLGIDKLIIRNMKMKVDLPISGIAEAAGGVDSANSNNKTKKATNIFIPLKTKQKKNW